MIKSVRSGWLQAKGISFFRFASSIAEIGGLNIKLYYLSEFVLIISWKVDEHIWKGQDKATDGFL